MPEVGTLVPGGWYCELASQKTPKRRWSPQRQGTVHLFRFLRHPDAYNFRRRRAIAQLSYAPFSMFNFPSFPRIIDSRDPSE